MSMGSSTYTVYVRGRPRSASFGSTYMMEVRPRISRGRIATRTKLVGSSFDETANTGSRPLSNQAPPGITLRAGASPTVMSSAPAIKQRTPPPRCRCGSATPPGAKSTRSARIKYSARGSRSIGCSRRTVAALPGPSTGTEPRISSQRSTGAPAPRADLAGFGAVPGLILEKRHLTRSGHRHERAASHVEHAVQRPQRVPSGNAQRVLAQAQRITGILRRHGRIVRCARSVIRCGAMRAVMLGLLIASAWLAVPRSTAAFSIQEAILRVKPGVVLISAEVRADVTLDCGRGPVSVSPAPFIETGTGWFVDGRGFLVTNAHVVDPAHRMPPWVTHELKKKAIEEAYVVQIGRASCRER